jgi:hypothetical protein
MNKFKKYYTLELSLLCIWILLWFCLGTHMTETFNIHKYYSFKNFNFFRSNLIFYIFLILLIYSFVNKKTSLYLILSLYPIFGFIGTLINSNESIYFSLHYSISLLALILFVNFINTEKIDKKYLFYLIHYSTLFILTLYFIFFIAPDLFSKILNLQYSARGESAATFKLSENTTFYYPQNSNGASRIILILTIFFTCIYSFLIQKKITINNFLLLIVIIIFASLNIFYQSKLNILAFIIANLIIFLRNDNYKKKLYIFSLILIITLPFLIIFFYQKNFTRVENRLLNSEEGIFVFNKYELPRNILNLDKLDYDKLDFSNLNKICISHNTSLDKFFGGRICGWEILTKLYFQNLKFFGYGFFDDRRILKKLEKISSNSYIFVLFNAGIVSFLIIIIFFVNIFFKMIKSYNLLKIHNSDIIIPLYYVLLTGYLIARSFLEDTLAFMSVDFLLLINCIVFFNYFFYTSSILDKNR